MRITILVVVAHLAHPRRSACSITSFRPEALVRHARAGGRRSRHPFRAGEWTLENYRQALDAGGFKQRVPQQPGRGHPRHGDPDHDRRLRRLRVLLDGRSAGRHVMFVLVVGLMVVPLQMALIPILRLYTSGAPSCGVSRSSPTSTSTARSSASGWPTPPSGCRSPPTCCATTSARCRRRSSSRPRSTAPTTSRSSGGWSSRCRCPALAAFAIFQFLWVWNDLLIAYVFLGGTKDTRVVTIALANLVGSRGENWHLLTSAAFISMALPLARVLLAAALLRARAHRRVGEGVSRPARRRRREPRAAAAPSGSGGPSRWPRSLLAPAVWSLLAGLVAVASDDERRPRRRRARRSPSGWR